MKIHDFSSAVGRSLTAFGSHDVRFTPILGSASVRVVCLRVQPSGVIAAHAAAENQLFLVVEGAGWVRSGSSARVDIKAGQAALWERGEVHESGSEAGLVAIVLEGPGIQPELPTLDSGS